MKESNRVQDARLEGIVNDFLDKYFFNDGFEKVQWVTDRKKQISGIDIVLSSKKFGVEDANVDAKSAVKYSDRYLGTYSLELSFINKNGVESTGWFVNDGLSTEYYFLLYPRSKKHYTEMESPQDIDYIDYYLVEKKELMKFFESRGYTKERLMDVSKGMRKTFNELDLEGKLPENRKYIENSDSENFHFSLSGHLAEQPINIVLKRSVYDRYSKAKGRIEKK